jgi:hypothetical protein
MGFYLALFTEEQITELNQELNKMNCEDQARTLLALHCNDILVTGFVMTTVGRIVLQILHEREAVSPETA